MSEKNSASSLTFSRYVKLSEANAKAIQGLEPKINVWTTGGAGEAAGPIGQIFKNLPPLIDTIYSQTGIRPPNWLANTDNLTATTPTPAALHPAAAVPAWRTIKKD